MKNLVVFGLVANGLMTIRDNEQEFRKGFLFAFYLQGEMYALYNAETQNAYGEVETALHIYTYKGGAKRVEKVFKVNKFRRNIIAAYAEVARLFSQMDDAAFVISEEGQKVVEWREQKYREALVSGKLEQFAAETTAMQGDKMLQFAPIAAVQALLTAQAFALEAI